MYLVDASLREIRAFLIDGGVFHSQMAFTSGAATVTIATGGATTGTATPNF